MIHLNPKSTAVIAVDMHRGHLDPTVATLPLPADRCSGIIQRATRLFRNLRGLGVPIVHVVSEFRDVEEQLSNPFWKAINDDPTKARRGGSKHNLLGGPGVEIVPQLFEKGDFIIHGKKRYSPFFATDLHFLLNRRLKVDTVILAGINTTSCVLCAGFEATNLDYRVVIASEACDSMDGEEMHNFALRLMSYTVGWTLTSAEVIEAFGTPKG
ncbi:cysteine hydrolase [Thermodesulfobacteriota bacterium]